MKLIRTWVTYFRVIAYSLSEWNYSALESSWYMSSDTKRWTLNTIMNIILRRGSHYVIQAGLELLRWNDFLLPQYLEKLGQTCVSLFLVTNMNVENNRLKGWRDSLLVKNIYCTFRGYKFNSQHPCWVAHSSKEPEASGLGGHCIHMLIAPHRYTHIHIIRSKTIKK